MGVRVWVLSWWFDKGRVQSAAVVLWFSLHHTPAPHANDQTLTHTYLLTIKNIENYVTYLMESNTQADDVDNQINCVIEPFYFIDDFNEFWWRFDVADTLSHSPFFFSSLIHSSGTRFCSLAIFIEVLFFNTLILWCSPENSPWDLLPNKRKPRENDRNIFRQLDFCLVDIN